jgi:hypothetical protein
MHSPDTVENPGLKRRWQATEGRNSPVWSTLMVSVLQVGEQLWALVKLWDLCMGREVGVRWLGTDEVVKNRGECGGDGLPEADTALVWMRRRGWPPFIVVHCVEATRAAP